MNSTTAPAPWSSLLTLGCSSTSTTTTSPHTLLPLLQSPSPHFLSLSTPLIKTECEPVPRSLGKAWIPWAHSQSGWSCRSRCSLESAFLARFQGVAELWRLSAAPQEPLPFVLISLLPFQVCNSHFFLSQFSVQWDVHNAPWLMKGFDKPIRNWKCCVLKGI